MHIAINPEDPGALDHLPVSIAIEVQDYLDEGYAVGDYLSDCTVKCFQCDEHFDDEQGDGLYSHRSGAWTCFDCLEAFR